VQVVSTPPDSPGRVVHSAAHKLWAIVNERDEIGPDLVPDYLTSVREGAFYGRRKGHRSSLSFL